MFFLQMGQCATPILPETLLLCFLPRTCELYISAFAAMNPHGSQTIKLWVSLQCGSEQMPDAKTLGQFFFVDGMIVVEERDRREDRSQSIENF